MSEILTNDSSICKEIIQSDNRKQVNIKNEPHEETDNHEYTEGIADTKLLKTVKETDNNKVIHIKEEVTNDEVTGAVATDVNDVVDIKFENADITENVYDQKLVIDNEGVNKIKSEVDKSRISCEVTKGVHRGRATLVSYKSVILEDIGLNNNTQHCHKQLTNRAPTTEYKQNVIHHIPIKKESLFAHKNIFGSTSVDGNIGENLNAIDPGKTSHTVNTRSEALPQCKELRVVLEDIMLTRNKHNTQDSLVQLTAQSSKENRTVSHPTIKNKNILIDPEKISNVASFSTDIIDGNISITPNDTETTKTIFICDICNKQFGIKKSLRKHIKKHSEMYSCTYCSFKTRYKCYLKTHINAVHTKSTAFTCDYCSYVTYFKNLLKIHINKKHAESVSNNCVYCSNVTYREDKLSDQINAEHTNTTAFNCSHCNLKTFRKNKQDTNIPHAAATVYNCTRCSYKTYEKWNCIRHVNAIHTKTKVYNCSLCSYTAFNKLALAKHVNVKHTKKNVYKCSHCNYKAYNDSNLKIHVNVMHTKTTVYNCSHCSYKAYNTCTLSKHVNAKHTKTVFNCSYCTFDTNYQTSLARHINARHSKLKKITLHVSAPDSVPENS